MQKVNNKEPLLDGAALAIGVAAENPYYSRSPLQPFSYFFLFRRHPREVNVSE